MPPVQILSMSDEPHESGSQIQQAPAQAADSTDQFTKANMRGKGAVNDGPGNAPQQAVTHSRGQVR
jgi:hypothetical protein